LRIDIETFHKDCYTLVPEKQSLRIAHIQYLDILD
jgi:hypothetical protein